MQPLSSSSVSTTLELPDPDVQNGFSAYIHIPFCARRCGYCDFNTYTNLHFPAGAGAAEFPTTLCREIELSAKMLNAGTPAGELRSVFFGGGTPTLLPATALKQILEKLRSIYGISATAEITTEANPETLTYEKLCQLQESGINRISFGMQSAVESVLQTLDRMHTPGQTARVCHWAEKLGMRYSLDLIYGTPGESMADWDFSLREAIALGPEHISAYALTVEKNTKMGRALQREEIPAPDPDILADKYQHAEETLTSHGYQWYEISNWARPGAACQHNLHYWQRDNYWGYGPGAHSCINDTRFWNTAHPLAYAQQLISSDLQLPIAGQEHLGAAEIREEEIMLGIRCREGIPLSFSPSPAITRQLLADGLIDAAAWAENRLQLTLRGRLLADTVIRALW